MAVNWVEQLVNQLALKKVVMTVGLSASSLVEVWVVL
jgi:hypothetical protein